MAFLADAKETHGVTISRKAEFRRPRMRRSGTSPT